jgi:uncharacterized protein YndB with AHSA1/START domain
MRVETMIPAASEKIWDYLIQPEHFNVFAGGTKTIIADQKEGRVTDGSVYQCYHGEEFIAMTVLEWHPFERILVQTVPPIPIKGATCLIEITLESVDNGTKFSQVFGKAKGPFLARTMVNLAFRSMATQGQVDIDNFGKHVAADLAGRGEAPRGEVPSPETIADAARAGLSDLEEGEV